MIEFTQSQSQMFLCATINFFFLFHVRKRRSLIIRFIWGEKNHPFLWKRPRDSDNDHINMYNRRKRWVNILKSNDNAEPLINCQFVRKHNTSQKISLKSSIKLTKITHVSFVVDKNISIRPIRLSDHLQHSRYRHINYTCSR